MKNIIVRVTHKETGQGIPNILASAYIADTKLEKALRERQPSPDKLSEALSQNIRIGSKLSDTNGYVTLTYGADPKKHLAKEVKPTAKEAENIHLVVTLMGPDGADKDFGSRLLYISNEAIKNIGDEETINVEISGDQLSKANIAFEEKYSFKGRPEEEEKAQQQFNARLNKLIGEKVKAETKKTATFEKNFKKAISKVSIPNTNLLKEEEDLVKKQKSIVVKKIAEVNAASVNGEGVILLTKDQKDALAPFLSGDKSTYVNVPASIIDPILFSNKDDKQGPGFLLRENTVAEYCRQITSEEKCSKEFLADNTPEAPQSNGAPATQESSKLTDKDIPIYLKNLINLQSAPEEKVFFGVEQSSARATQQDVQESIDSFVLKKGPADSTAYFDFHNLKIAFEHIWMEAIDEEVLNLGRRAYGRIVELLEGTVNPNLSLHNPPTLLAYGKYIGIAMEKPIPAIVVSQFEITQENWNDLPYSLQAKLEEIAQMIEDPKRISTKFKGFTNNLSINFTPRKEREIFRLRQQGERIIAFVQDDSYRSLHKILRDLNKKLKEKYAFTIFPVKDNGRRSINFGTVVTYRQKWEPLNYQAGELVKTIALTPKEERKINYKVNIKQKRSVKERNNHSSTHREESNVTARAEAEIVRKALIKTNFNLSAEGSQDYLLSDGTYKTGFSRDAEKDSQETKKEFRESVRKASQEYKSERTIEITTEDTFESEFTQSATIVNPNDELGLTCLFYELQRRFRVSEEIHRLTPVILVAQEVPAPHEIDEDWLIRHDWILRRVILDDSFIPALNYLSLNLVGDEYALKELKKGLTLQRELVAELKQEAVELQQQVDHRYRALENAINTRIGAEEDEETDSWFTNVGEFFGIGSDESPEAAKAREQAAQDAHEHAVNQAKDTASKLQREITALNASTERYTKQLSAHLNRKTQIERLRIHVKDNILYYMQAIWTHEPPDQRFFRLHNTTVPHFEVQQKTYNITVAENTSVWTGIEGEGTAHDFQLNTNINTNLVYKDLIEVADLDNLLGFKGNYMIFPLIVPNALTEFMMAPYVDVAFGLRDPDEAGNMTLQDFSKYICCLKEEMSDADFQKIKPALKEYYGQLLKSPLRNGEDIMVATDSLFVELLPSSHSLLEEFKLMHRAIDVKKVQAEVREMELENIRLAARLLAGEREDPDVEAKYVFEGNSSVVAPAPPDNNP